MNTEDKKKNSKSPLLPIDHDMNSEKIASTSMNVEMDTKDVEQKNARLLVVTFVAMIVVGLGNKIFQKLQTIPMHNYPFFLSILSTFIYIPTSFMYIIPMQLYGTAITKECQAIPKYKFAIMGVLDGIGGVMSVFAVNFITNSSMIILLTQASIPVSMALSRTLLKAEYTKFQYFGSVVVVVGIIVVLIPSLLYPQTASGGSESQILWAMVLVLSCIPQVLSSVYKEQALGETDMDVFYLNGWVAIYQFMVCLPLAIPSAWASHIAISELPSNIINGAKCYMGTNSIVNGTAFSPPDDCSLAFTFVTIYLSFNLIYNVLLILILKYGSANILWLAMTIMVPLGNVAFSLDFIPGHMPLKTTDILGLVVIMLGLIFYRFADKVFHKKRSISFFQEDEGEDAAAHHVAMYLGVNGIEMIQPIMDNYKRKYQELLRKSPLQIRNSYLTRLGFTPSPSVSYSPLSKAATLAVQSHPPERRNKHKRYKSFEQRSTKK